MSPESVDVIYLVKESESLVGIVQTQYISRDRIVEFYKSDKDINS